MLPNWGSASTVSNSSAGTDAGDDAFMMDVDAALNALSDEPPSVNLSDAVADEALLEETARVFAGEWSVAEQLYPPPNGGAAYQNCLFTVNVCRPAGQSACADAPRFAVKAMRHRFQELPAATQTRVRREVAIMRALDSDFTVRLAERPYVNGGIVYLVRCAAGKPPAQANERCLIASAPPAVTRQVMPHYQCNFNSYLVERLHSGFQDGDQSVRTVARRILCALQYLHDTLGVVHRDIKCAPHRCVRSSMRWMLGQFGSCGN